VARDLRHNFAGDVFHVYARGNARGRVYLDTTDRQRYLGILGKVAVKKQWVCFSYCLMNNHVHLLLKTPEPNLSSGMQLLHGSYAQAFNFRHERTGHVFQGRFGAVRIEADHQLCAAAAYIARNPVDAGLCVEPGDWAWSSFRATAHDEASPSWLAADELLTYFGQRRKAARQQFTSLSESVGYDPEAACRRAKRT
jgi:putative transposase